MNTLIYIIIAILFAFFSFIATNDFIVAAIVLVCSLLCFLLLINKRKVMFDNKAKRYHSCYRFINNFIISLSIKGVTSSALEIVTPSMDEEFKEEYETLTEFSDFDKLDYLKKFYKFHIYELFLNLVSLYEEQGGNILKMSNFLIDESRVQEEYLNRCQTLGKRKIIEFSVLWLFSLAILVVLRFVLSDFFEMISQQIIYKVSIVGLFLFLLASAVIIVNKTTTIEIRGWDDNE